MGIAVTRNMHLPHHRELILRAARRYDIEIIDVKDDQRYHHLSVHNVELARYGRQLTGMERMKADIEAGLDDITLACNMR